MTGDKKLERLTRRLRTGYAGPAKGMTLPGSMNGHKCMPAGNGKRARTKIAADSRNAA